KQFQPEGVELAVEGDEGLRRGASVGAVEGEGADRGEQGASVDEHGTSPIGMSKTANGRAAAPIREALSRSVRHHGRLRGHAAPAAPARGTRMLRSNCMNTVPSAFRPRVRTPTMPCSGRLFDGRIAVTSLSA